MWIEGQRNISRTSKSQRVKFDWNWRWRCTYPLCGKKAAGNVSGSKSFIEAASKDKQLCSEAYSPGP
ncbi:hypothetical protein B0H12DRAFT_1085865, partial [Mycena haematopus]